MPEQSQSIFTMGKLQRKLNDFSMGQKVFALVFIPLALMASVQIFSYMENKAFQQLSISNETRADLFHLRIDEHDVILEKEKTAIDSFKIKLQVLKEHIERFSDKDLKDDLKQQIETYRTTFFEIVTKLEKQGLNYTDGLQGEIRSSIHETEKFIHDAGKSELLPGLLTLRRNEKDCQLQNIEKYYPEWQGNFTEFLQTIEAMDIEATPKQTLLSSVDEYKTAFEGWISIHKQIKKQRSELDGIAENIETLLDEFNISAEKAAQAEMVMLSVFFILALTVSVLFAYFGKRFITEPIFALQRVADEIANGNFDLNVHCEAKDEIGQLTRAFGKMVTRVSQLLGYVNKLPNPTFVIDKEFNIEFMSESGLSLLGKSKGNIVGKKCFDLFKTNDCHTDKCACAAAMKKDQLVTRENVARPKGTEVPIIYTGSPLKDKNGEITGAIENIAVFTEIKEREDYLKRSVQAMLTEMEKVAMGDLDIVLHAEKSGDDVAQLFEGFQTAIANIRSMIMQVVDASNSLASAAEQLSSSSQKLRPERRNKARKPMKSPAPLKR